MESLNVNQIIQIGGEAKPIYKKVPPHIQKRIDEAKAKAAENSDPAKLAEKLEKAEQNRKLQLEQQVQKLNQHNSFNKESKLEQAITLKDARAQIYASKQPVDVRMEQAEKARTEMLEQQKQKLNEHNNFSKEIMLHVGALKYTKALEVKQKMTEKQEKAEQARKEKLEQQKQKLNQHNSFNKDNKLQQAVTLQDARAQIYGQNKSTALKQDMAEDIRQEKLAMEKSRLEQERVNYENNVQKAKENELNLQQQLQQHIEHKQKMAAERAQKILDEKIQKGHKETEKLEKAKVVRSNSKTKEDEEMKISQWKP